MLLCFKVDYIQFNWIFYKDSELAVVSLVYLYYNLQLELGVFKPQNELQEWGQRVSSYIVFLSHFFFQLPLLCCYFSAYLQHISIQLSKLIILNSCGHGPPSFKSIYIKYKLRVQKECKAPKSQCSHFDTVLLDYRPCVQFFRVFWYIAETKLNKILDFPLRNFCTVRFYLKSILPLSYYFRLFCYSQLLVFAACTKMFSHFLQFHYVEINHSKIYS